MNDAPSRKKKRRRPKRRKRRLNAHKLANESTLVVIDRLLLTPVRTVVNGKQVRITALEAIARQLIQREIAGDAQASSVLLGYEQLAKRRGAGRLDIVFADGAHPLPVAASRGDNDG